MKNAPTIAQLTAEVIAYRDELRSYNPADIADDEGNPSGDIRLQIVDGTWHVHTGDAQYDQDHRGNWGASSVSPDMSAKACRDIARDLIAQASE